MNPYDTTALLMLTGAAMLFVGAGSGFVLGLFWRWFFQREEKRR